MGKVEIFSVLIIQMFSTFSSKPFCNVQSLDKKLRNREKTLG